MTEQQRYEIISLRLSGKDVASIADKTGIEIHNVYEACKNFSRSWEKLNKENADLKKSNVRFKTENSRLRKSNDELIGLLPENEVQIEISKLRAEIARLNELCLDYLGEAWRAADNAMMAAKQPDTGRLFNDIVLADQKREEGE